jgi:dienelactone hydrolase
MRYFTIILAILLSGLPRSVGAEPSPVEMFLKKEIIGPRVALQETQEFVDSRIPRLPAAKSVEEWTHEAQRIREKVLKDVVFRGEAAKWRDAKCKEETLEAVPGTEGYTLKKVRYEIIPGFWIPALLYEPAKLEGKVPVMLAVNGHDGKGKATDYKQTRCINLAKRGMLVLNVEWLGMGQLNAPGNAHGAMNQLDLCGTGGLAPFYLSMSRGLDLLLAHPNADPKRVAVSGLSGGGWQTIFISSLDTRVTLTNPVAGYSSFRTRVQHFKDLGDSEQTPCDLATVADYATLTAMMAPRPTLLTFNAKDNCCFEAGYALPPLRDGALLFFKLYGAEKNLRTHVNDVPGDHNFGQENREALYRMIGDHFYPGEKTFSATEIECKKEIKTKDELKVKLPDDNLTMNTLALNLAKDLPRNAALPTEKEKFETWRKERVAALERVTRFLHITDGSIPGPEETKEGNLVIKRHRMPINKSWTLPFVELTKGEPKGTTIILNDAGRAASAAKVEELLKAGQRVIVADLFYFGEGKPNPKDWLWALMVGTVGERPLGIQAGELAALAGWAGGIKMDDKPVAVCAIGPRSSAIALTTAAIEPKMIASLDLHNPLVSFKEIIETNRTVDKTPELFCFGLLEEFDVKQIVALVAPRPIKIVNPSERAKKEFGELKEFYKLLGKEFDPLK